MPDFTIRAAEPPDAAPLSAFAAHAFAATFGDDNAAADMTRYLAEAFTPERQAAEITDADGVVLLAEAAGGRTAPLVGYAHLVAGPAPAAVTGPAPIELKRLYVDRRWHGRGVAAALMDAALVAAAARGARTVWLGVWERNARAAAFYAKHGFARVGEHTFLLGSDPQTDWLMARTVGA
ncbi:N-acetyltransferase [Gemmatimonadetes bacterium T265]|nr:N-acetyltransferase [Gemmatimonadetes bacterium T265]